MKKTIFTLLFFAITSFLSSSLFAESIVPEEKLSYTFKSDQVQNLDVNFAAGKVILQESLTGDININITKDYDAPSPTAKIDKGTLVVKTTLLSSYKKKISIVIEIPYGKKLENIQLTCVSANSTLKRIEADNINITSASGYVQIDKCKISDHLKIGGGAGSLSIKNTEANYITVSSVSGETEITACSCKLLRTETVSGKVVYSKLKTDSFEAQGLSGTLEAQFDKMIEEDSWIKTGTGTVNIVFPKGKGYKAVVSSLSGQFIDQNTNVTGVQCDDLISQYKNGNVEIKINTKTGSVSISSQ